MERWENELPIIAMVSLQCVYATINLLHRGILINGTSPTVFVFYRQAIATFFTTPIAYFTRNKSNETSSIGIRGFLLMFVTALIGLALCQNFYNEGLYLASSSTASAMNNLVPAITFIIAAILGMEKVNVKRLSSIAKILGTILCVAGAASLALLKGPKLLDAQLSSTNFPVLWSLKTDKTWLLGCILLFGMTCCWSLWLILQVPLTTYCPNHIALSAWMCFLSTLQTGVIALFLERDPKAWNLSSSYELIACFFSGIFGAGIQYFVQAWCISLKGPLFSAMFNPLSTVITTVLASIFLHEQVYIGTLLGAIAVIIGLYVVLWGKANEMKGKSTLEQGNNTTSQTNHDNTSCTSDLERPLLIDNSH